jgi:hypothetical protein
VQAPAIGTKSLIVVMVHCALRDSTLRSARVSESVSQQQRSEAWHCWTNQDDWAALRRSSFCGFQ